MQTISIFLHQAGYPASVYWFVALGSLGLFLGMALAPVASRNDRVRPWLPIAYLATLLLAMLAWRWPAILQFKVVNPDEPQFLAGALTMQVNARFWWVDATTSGPLVVLPLTAPGWFGLPINYATGRVVGLLLEWGQVAFVYLALRHVFGDRRAGLLALPLATLMICLFFWDFVPYCSELAPTFLSALAVWLGTTAFAANGRMQSIARLAASGAVLGVLPFSKFQVLPIGAGIGAVLAVWTLAQPDTPGRDRLRHLAAFGGGALAVLISLMLGLYASGLAADFYRSYVVHNLNYAQARALPWSDSLYVLRYLSTTAWGFATFHAALLILLGVSFRAARRAHWRWLLLGWIGLLAAYIAVLTPGRLYPHYLLFLAWPLTLAAGVQFGHLIDEARPLRGWAWLWIALTVVPQLVERGWERPELARLIRPVAPWHDVAGFINRVKQPGDSLAVWGWRPELYVDTQLPQATREGHTNAQLAEGPLREYYRHRFLEDLRRNRPAFFIDSVGPDDFGHRQRASDAHEAFPELAAHVRDAYVAVNPANSIRLFVRRDLAR